MEYRNTDNHAFKNSLGPKKALGEHRSSTKGSGREDAKIVNGVAESLRGSEKGNGR